MAFTLFCWAFHPGRTLPSSAMQMAPSAWVSRGGCLAAGHAAVHTCGARRVSHKDRPYSMCPHTSLLPPHHHRQESNGSPWAATTWGRACTCLRASQTAPPRKTCRACPSTSAWPTGGALILAFARRRAFAADALRSLCLAGIEACACMHLPHPSHRVPLTPHTLFSLQER